MKELEKTRQHIQRIGTIIYQASRVGIVIMIILIILQAVLTAAVLASESVAGFVAPRLDNSFLFNVIKAVTDIEKIDTKDQAAIGCFVTLISYGMILVMLKMFTGVMKRLAAGERPFNAEVALKIRHGSFYLLFFLLYNPLLAVISFGLVMLVSFLMEYGSYLQDRSDETNRIQEEIIMSFAEITENKSGQTVQVPREIDFIATRGGRKTYIQSAYALPTEEKALTENRPLALTGDSFPKIIVRHDIRKRWYDDNGILNIGILDFLLDDRII